MKLMLVDSRGHAYVVRGSVEALDLTKISDALSLVDTIETRIQAVQRAERRDRPHLSVIHGEPA